MYSLNSFEEFKSSYWLEEQLQVAARVEIFDDENDFEVKLLDQTDRFTLFRQVNGNSLKKSKGDDINSAQQHDRTDGMVDYYFGGVDVSFANSNHQKDSAAVAVYVIMEYSAVSNSGADQLRIIYQDHEFFDVNVPYIPSFLAFREIDPLQRLIQRQMVEFPHLTPSCILVDGNGILHPRRAGLACFVGVRTGLPTIGVGKTLYHEGELTREMVFKGLDEAIQGAADYMIRYGANLVPDSFNNILFDEKLIRNSEDCSADSKPRIGEERVKDPMHALVRLQALIVPLGCKVVEGSSSTGAVHRTLACAIVAHGGRATKNKVSGSKQPIYVSVGHRMSLRRAAIICAKLSLYRIPEPLRQADLIGRALQRSRNK